MVISWKDWTAKDQATIAWIPDVRTHRAPAAATPAMARTLSTVSAVGNWKEVVVIVFLLVSWLQSFSIE